MTGYCADCGNTLCICREVRLDQLIDHHLEHEIDRGTVIRNLGAWRNATRQQLLADEATWPGYIERSLRAIQAKRDGRRITRCREARGTHGMSYVYDPDGTAEPPSWWNRDAAKIEENAYRQRIGLEPYP